jgi:hypothetical protein
VIHFDSFEEFAAAIGDDCGCDADEGGKRVGWVVCPPSCCDRPDHQHAVEISRETVLAAVTDEPRSASAIYLAMNGLPPDTAFTISHRHARKRVGTTLQFLFEDGLIQQEITGDGERVHTKFFR